MKLTQNQLTGDSLSAAYKVLHDSRDPELMRIGAEMLRTSGQNVKDYSMVITWAYAYLDAEWAFYHDDPAYSGLRAVCTNLYAQAFFLRN